MTGTNRSIHIISFDIPYPPNYGGVIDVFYKIEMLSKEGVKVILHVFEYPGRDRSEVLNDICEKVYYYPRKTGFRSLLCFKPYIVFSRRSQQLLDNLIEDDYPILFEGLHTTYYLKDRQLKGRKKIFRAHNIEHHYYYNLFKAERIIRRKVFYLLESFKLKIFERRLKYADLICTVSQSDEQYIKRNYPEVESIYLPSFHRNNEVFSMAGKGDYVLYNGNLEVSENMHALEYIIKEIFNDIPQKLIIAGMNPLPKLKQLVAGFPNISIVENPDDDEMFRLIREAHINIMVTFQGTGLKLKLINALYNGRHILVNSKMLNGTGLDSLCEVADEATQMKAKIDELFKQSFNEVDLNKRKAMLLNGVYANRINVERLMNWL